MHIPDPPVATHARVYIVGTGTVCPIDIQPDVVGCVVEEVG